MTFAMTRHAVVDIAQVLKRKPSDAQSCFDRLNEEAFARVKQILADNKIELEGAEPEKRLRELRQMYEPYVFALSEHLLMPLPPWTLTSGLPVSFPAVLTPSMSYMWQWPVEPR